MTLRRDYKVELTAVGGREPYTWTLLDDAGKDEKGNPYFGVKGLIFTVDERSGKATISGKVSDLGLSDANVGVRVKVSSAPSIIMEPGRATLNISVQEPGEQAKDIQGWIAFGLTLVVSAFPFAHSFKDRCVDLHNWRVGKEPEKNISDIHVELKNLVEKSRRSRRSTGSSRSGSPSGCSR